MSTHPRTPAMEERRRVGSKHELNDMANPWVNPWHKVPLSPRRRPSPTLAVATAHGIAAGAAQVGPARVVHRHPEGHCAAHCDRSGA